MTVDQDAAEAEVRISPPWFVWMWPLVLWVPVAAIQLSSGHVGLVSYGLGLGLFAGLCWWSRTFGVELTTESANVRGGLLRRNVAWKEVQAVVCYRHFGECDVRLILESGMTVTLRAPRSALGLGGARYERDFQRIEQWWLAHRGESWRPVSPAGTP